jgi:hypothetical protein
LCKGCGKYFSASRKTNRGLIKQLWKEYVFNKQTIRELAETHKKDKRTIKSLLDKYQPPEKHHSPRAVHLIVDATYFGERTNQKSWCVVVARDQYTKENLWWTFAETETTSVYRQMRNELEALDYTILSVTGDGFGGIKSAFSGIPYQMCQVHMKRIIITGTTRKPKLEAGQVLLAFGEVLKDIDSHHFRVWLRGYIKKYGAFLNEKSFNTETGEWQWTHRELRRAALSLVRFEPYLFTFEHNRRIPKTTNSLEGHFRHINEIVAVHCGLSRAHKEKLLHTILLAGTVAPNKSLLSKIL